MTVPIPAAGSCGKQFVHHMKPHVKHLSDSSEAQRQPSGGSCLSGCTATAARASGGAQRQRAPRGQQLSRRSSCASCGDPLALPRHAGSSATRSQRCLRMAAATCVNLRDCRSASDDLKPGALFRCSQVMRWVPTMSLPDFISSSTVHLARCKLRSRHGASPALQLRRLDEARCQGEAAVMPFHMDGALQQQELLACPGPAEHEHEQSCKAMPCSVTAHAACACLVLSTSFACTPCHMPEASLLSGCSPF